MRNFIENAGKKISKMVAMVGKTATKCMVKIQVFKGNAKLSLCNQRGENYVDSGVKILIAIVLGGLLLGGLYLLFEDVILVELTDSIKKMFNYAG